MSDAMFVWDQQNYCEDTCVSIEDDYTKRRSGPSLYCEWKMCLSAFRIRMGLIKTIRCCVWTGEMDIVYLLFIWPPRQLVAARFRWRRPTRCLRLTADYHCYRMWARRHENWNHQHWPHVIHANESRVSPGWIVASKKQMGFQREWVLSIQWTDHSWSCWMVQPTSYVALKSFAKISFAMLGQLSKKCCGLLMTTMRPILQAAYAISWSRDRSCANLIIPTKPHFGSSVVS